LERRVTAFIFKCPWMILVVLLTLLEGGAAF